jgi:hypothetical protein
MIESGIFAAGVLFGCLLSRYFVGLGNKISMNAQDGEPLAKKHKPTEQDSTD